MTPDDEAASAAPEAEAFRLALFALVRLKAFDPLASAVLAGDPPVSTWWPVAYALQRVGDPRAAPALVQLLQVPGRYTAAFAARGLGVLKHTAAADSPDGDARPEDQSAARGRGERHPRTGADERAGSGARSWPRSRRTPARNPNVRLEALSALGAMKSSDGLAVAQDLLTDDWPALRAAALRAAAAIDPEAFTFVLSGLEPDRDWRVRAAMAETLGTLSPAVALERAHAMLQDSDQRVLAAVLGALVQLHAPDAAPVLTDHLKDRGLRRARGRRRRDRDLEAAGRRRRRCARPTRRRSPIRRTSRAARS